MIRNDNDEVLMSSDDHEPGIVATYVTEGCVAAGCHTLVMEDTGGNGMCGFDQGGDGVCDFGGTMSLTNANGDTLAGFDVADSNFGLRPHGGYAPPFQRPTTVAKTTTEMASVTLAKSLAVQT